MNILKRELRAGLKPFLFWSLGLFVLIFAGLTKFTGIESSTGGADLSALLNQFPRVVLAIMGMAGADINTLGGYYAVLIYYAMICAMIYAVYLGNTAVSREAVDKTYEFIFTKPRTRAYILSRKLMAAWSYLLAFCVLNYIFSLAAVATLGFTEDLHMQMFLFTVTLFLTGSLFLGLACFLSAALATAEKGGLYSNLCVLFAFVTGVLYDMLENAGILKLVSPLKYFDPTDLLSRQLDPVFAVLCVALTAALLWGAFVRFSKKDLMAA